MAAAQQCWYAVVSGINPVPLIWLDLKHLVGVSKTASGTYDVSRDSEVDHCL
jgi:hypothetical protein